MRSVILFTYLLASTFFCFSQDEKKYVREGNKLYDKEKYAEAEHAYKESLLKKKDNPKAIFNLGDAYYKQGKYEEAAGQFEILTQRKMPKDSLAQAYHNLGNSYLKSKKYDESIKAYKNALKNNPADEDTRYNLAYAMKMLQQQQQQKNKDNKNENKEQQKQEEKKQDQKKDVKDQPQPQPQISKEEAKKIMEALNNDEKEIQKKLKKQKAKANKVEIEKDW
jgi:Ca-activated chloride channel family protein